MKRSWSRTVRPRKLEIKVTDGPLGEAIDTVASSRIRISARHRHSSSVKRGTQVAKVVEKVVAGHDARCESRPNNFNFTEVMPKH